MRLCSVVLQTGECASECFCLRCPPQTSINNTVATGQYLISWRRYVHVNGGCDVCCWVFRGLEQTSKTLFDRNSSSPDSPLIQTIVSLPHVVLEMVPLYIHAGQYASIACTQCS